jgi:DNA repair exonuclease SbcCD nuclease subunit
MRIVHFADNHLGAGADRREQDILDSFAETVDKIIALKPDLVINAGDLFHMVRPSNRVIAFASEQLIRLGRDAEIPTVIISGNHDAPKQRHIGAVLAIFKNYENIHVIYKSRYERIKLGKCAVSAVPHCLTTETLKEQLEKIEPDQEAKYNILVLHGVVGGIKEFQMADLSEQEIASSYFRLGFDYVALGHYHNFTKVEENTYYSGSTERLSQSEAAHKKGFIELNFEDNERKVVFHEVKSRVMIDLPVMRTKGKSAEEIMAELEKAVKGQKPEDKIIRIKVTDIAEETYRSLPFDKIAELKEKSFSLDVRFEKEETPEENIYADLNLGRLDQAFEKFLESKVVENLDKEELKKLALEFLHKAEGEEG